MVFKVYAPKSGPVTPWIVSRDRFYHRDCSSSSKPLMVHTMNQSLHRHQKWEAGT